jgi:hypothetical protein
MFELRGGGRMRGARAFWLALLLAAGFTCGVLHLMGVQFEAGDIYPEYSSLRTDPLGSKLLLDALSRLPGISAARSYAPLDYFTESNTAVLLLGTQPSSIANADMLRRLEKIAGRGDRVIVGLVFPKSPFEDTAPLANIWKVRLQTDLEISHPHPLYFSEAKDWKVLDRAGAKLLEVERSFGKGSVVLFAESDAFGNQALMTTTDPARITAALGANTRVLFDETHLGIGESGSVVGLARRYRLMGLALGLAICAALAIWRNASPFPAPVATAGLERMSGRTSFAGLVTLLRRHVPAQDLAATCWQEWLKTNRHQVAPERVRRAEAIARETSGRPLDAVREIQTVLYAKGEH